ncbi:hypothetical protein QPX65_08135 [Vibrio vulnificus]|nr:hypothetical protein [Vibrio vulnificus]WIL75719.1 hypothetical protein QPX65_08135 [Vibrio vulnificus]
MHPLTRRYNLKVNCVEYFITILNEILVPVVTLLAVYLTNRFHQKNSEIEHLRNVDKNKVERKIGKAEDLYMTFSEWKTQSDSIYLLYLSYYLNKIDYDVLLKSFNQFLTENKARMVSFDKVKMIVNIYFPELKDEINSIEKKKWDLGNFLDKKSIENYSAKEFKCELDNLDKQCQEFTEKLIVLINKL